MKENLKETYNNEIAVIEEKFKDKAIQKKFNALKDKIEILLDCPVNIGLDLNKKFGLESGLNGDLDSQNDYWTYHQNVIRELNDYNVDIEEKIFYFSGKIHDLSVSDFDTRLKTIMRLSEDFEKHATVQINSFGGDAYSMFGIIDIIKSSTLDIHTRCYGQVMSAGAMILASGKHRTMSENSYMMIHDAQTFLEGGYRDVKNEKNHLDNIHNRVYRYLERVSNKDAKWWENKLERNFYLSPEEALNLGLIDEIIKWK